MLYKIMMEQLGDADMIVGWAEKCKECEEPDLMKFFGASATERIKDFKEAHALLQQYVKSETANTPTVTSETVSTCLWEEQHEYLQNWLDKIEKRIKAL